jgi:hypothetical protein
MGIPEGFPFESAVDGMAREVRKRRTSGHNDCSGPSGTSLFVFENFVDGDRIRCGSKEPKAASIINPR